VKHLDAIRRKIQDAFRPIQDELQARIEEQARSRVKNAEMACLVRDEIEVEAETLYTTNQEEKFNSKAKRLANQAVLRVSLPRKRQHAWYVGDINADISAEDLIKQALRGLLFPENALPIRGRKT
jgi:hypothetical protein